MSGKTNRRRGNNYELQIVKELKDLGFECVVTSRSESKAKDNDKVDIIDKCGQLPFNIQIQIKKTAATPNYFKIRESSTVENETFVIIWNKQKRAKVNMVSEGESVILDKKLFYKLIEGCVKNNNNKK